MLRRCRLVALHSLATYRLGTNFTTRALHVSLLPISQIKTLDLVADLVISRMGELEPWIDENFIRSVWFGMGEQVNVKMIQRQILWVSYRITTKTMDSNVLTLVATLATASSTLLLQLPPRRLPSLNGSMIPNTSRPFKLNWASGGGFADRRAESRFIFLLNRAASLTHRLTIVQ